MAAGPVRAGQASPLPAPLRQVRGNVGSTILAGPLARQRMLRLTAVALVLACAAAIVV
jgi:hypothetical protein